MLKIFPVFLFLFVGLFILFCPQLLDFSLLPGDLGDSRFVNYIFEHTYLFLTNDSFHNSFFNPPFFYPNLNVLSYSDIVLGLSLIYYPFRFFGINPETSLQITVIIASILNYLSFFLVSKKIFKFSNLTSGLISFLFAFSLSRHLSVWHIQLSSQFLSVFSFYFFVKGVKNKNKLDFLISGAFLSLQFWTSYYLTWFFIFGVFLVCAIFLLNKNTYKIILDFIKINISGILIFSGSFLILSSNLIYHYFLVPKHSFEYTWRWAIKPLSFFVSNSFLNSFFTPETSGLNIENTIGTGIFTTILFVLALIHNKKFKIQTNLFIIFLIFLFSSSPLSYPVYAFFIGGAAIRAMGRVIFILLPVFCVVLGQFLDNKKVSTILLISILIVAEQIPSSYDYLYKKGETEERISKYSIPDDCSAFYIKGKNYLEVNSNIDAMFLSNKLKKPTMNGYSGYIPYPDYAKLPKNCIIENK